MNNLGDSLGKDYFRVGQIDMWEMFLVVYAHKIHKPYLKNVRKSYKATGVMNYVGNKGGLLLQFSMYDKLFVILNCHLKSGAR